jgi:hypothetical protein
LSTRITLFAKTDSQKVDHINHWITRHIKYDIKGYLTQRDKPWSSKKTIRKRKGLCGEYSQLFTDLCAQAGVKSVVVKGYSKNITTDNGDIFFTEDHAWNIFKMDEKWYLSDLTWAAGYLQIRYSPFYYYTYRLKLRKFPFKMTFKRDYDDFYLYNNGVQFSILHFPNASDYQLLKQPRSLDDFENHYLWYDTVRTYYLSNLNNAKYTCDQCENDPNREKLGKEYEISKQHLEENPRNTFSYLKNFVAYDRINATDVKEDTLRIKEEMKRYNKILPATICAGENVNLDYKINKGQIANKKRIFRNDYFNRYKITLRQNQKAVTTNKYFIKKSGRYIFSQKIRYFFKFKSLLLYRILLPIAPATQTKAERKRLRRYTDKKQDARNNSIASVNECNKLLSSISERDSLLGVKLLNAEKNYESNKVLHEYVHKRRFAFDDGYDLGMISEQDSIITRASVITNYLNSSTNDVKIIYKHLHEYIKLQKEFLFHMRKYKKYIIRCAYNDTKLDPYKMELRAADSIINNYYTRSLSKWNSEAI